MPANRLRNSIVVEGPDEAPSTELYERIGLVVADFLERRRKGSRVTIESYLVQFAGKEATVARECFEMARALMDLVLEK